MSKLSLTRSQNILLTGEETVGKTMDQSTLGKLKSLNKAISNLPIDNKH